MQRLLETYDKEDVVDYVRAWANCDYADVDDDGDVWISDPMRGHWLDAGKLAELVDAQDSYPWG